MSSSVSTLSAILWIIIFTAGTVSGCQCGSVHGKSAWQLAAAEAQGSVVIFEGTPEHFELKWDLLNAKDGSFVSASEVETPSGGPHMVVTFRVQRAYKGDLGPELKLATGLGGGDCGARFSPGLTYLVYAAGPTLSELKVSMCSPGGWIGDPRIGAELRYVRNQKPTAGDLAPHKGWSQQQSPPEEKRRGEDRERFRKRYEAATGTICGTVIPEIAKDSNAGTVSFLSTEGYSPLEHPKAQVNEDGSFCSGRLGPGKYYLFFTRVSDSNLSSALFYPETPELSKAVAIEVGAGQVESNIVFKVPMQKAYSIRGLISADDRSGLGVNNVSIMLIGGGVPSGVLHEQSIDFEKWLPLPKVKYFSFENVLPGRYVAYARVSSGDWFTKKVDLVVTTHMKVIFLELAHRKGVSPASNSPQH